MNSTTRFKKFETWPIASLSQKCTIRRNLSIASLVGRLQEKYRRISLPRTKLLTRWRISMAYQLPVDLAQIRFASQKKGGGATRANGIVFFSHRIRIHRWEIIQVITVYFESILILCFCNFNIMCTMILFLVS